MTRPIDRTKLVPLTHDFERGAPRGHLGKRKVEMGDGQKPRLENLRTHATTRTTRGNRIMDALVSGHRKARRVYSRELQGYSREVGRLLLNTASDRTGRISSQGLLDSLATLRENSRNLTEIGGHQYDTILSTRLEKELSSLDHEVLLKVYRGVLSEDLLKVRLMLGRELAADPENERAGNLLSDLNTLEAMVHTQVLERIAGGEANDHLPDHQGMTVKQLEILASTSRQSRKERLEMQSNFSTPEYFDVDRQDPVLEHKLEGYGITIQQVREALQQAPLTLNFREEDWFAKDSPVLDSQTCKNTWQLGNRPTGTNTYGRHRDFVEREMFKPLENGPLDPESRPIYTGLNVKKNVMGSAMTYGDSYLVLKPHVKTRCTLTKMDSFFMFDHKIEQQGVNRFFDRMIHLKPQLSQETRTGLTQENLDRIRTRLEEHLGEEFGVHHEEDMDGILEGILDGVGIRDQDRDALIQLAKRVFTVEGSGMKTLSSQENLEKVLETMQPLDLMQLANRVKDRSRINLGLGSYIEAQVHGEVDFSEDVEKIVVPEDVLEDQDKMKRIFQFARKHDIPVKTYSMGDLSLDRHPRIQPRENVREVPPPQEQVVEHSKFPEPNIPVKQGFKDFLQELPGILDVYQEHEKEFDPEGLHGRMHVCRALIYGRAMANLFTEKGMKLDTHALYRGIALHDAGRKENGKDLWEQDSAGLLQEYLAKEGIQDPDYLDQAWSMIDADPEMDEPTIEQGILQSVDSLEIIRVRGPEKFDRKKLWFMNQEVKQGENTVGVDPLLKEKLIFEVSQFIRLADPDPPGKVLYYQELDKSLPDMDKAREYRDQWNRELEERANQPSQDFFGKVEDVLLKNREKFPNLFHYYTSGGDGLTTEQPEIELVVVDAKEETESREGVREPRPDPEVLEVARDSIQEILALPDTPDRKIEHLLTLFSGFEGGETEVAAGDLINREINRLLENRPFTMPEHLSVTDIRQKAGSNVCYLLSTIASTLHTSWGPQAWKDMVEDMGDKVKVKFPDRNILLDKGEIFDIRSPNAPWVQVLERACAKYLGKSMEQLGNLYEVPHALGWRVTEIPAPEDARLIIGEGSQELKTQILAVSLGERIAQALKDGQGVTLLRSTHAVALTGMVGNKLTFFNSLTNFPEERTLEEIAGMMIANNANIALIKPN